jgi:hypothetical protein
MAPAWERARRALATRFCMRFAARRVVVEDAPRGMDDIEAEEEEEQEQQQHQEEPAEDEREMSLAAESEDLASSWSGSRSSEVRSLSPLAAVSSSAAHGASIRCATSFMILHSIDCLVLACLTVDMCCLACMGTIVPWETFCDVIVFPSLHEKNTDIALFFSVSISVSCV